MTAKETNPNCEHCGKPVDGKAVGGLCPACLLQVGLGSVEGTEFPSGRFDAPAPDDLADLFPQLEILELIGTGGMGAVYKALQRDLDRIVALKILAPRGKDDPSFEKRFTREARALARLNHPHIVAVHDFGHAGDLFYFVMEYVDGTNLRQVEQAGTLGPREALAIVPQICAALQFAHDRGVVHRDIKPENILLDKQGNVKIADFGLAKVMKQAPPNVTLTQEGHVMGTPHYMAPEQVEHPHEVDHRADIYSLGVVFYELLTGELPLGQFQAPSQMVQIDVRLDEVVLKTLAKEPQRRYQQVSQVGTEVRTIVTTPDASGATSRGGAIQSDTCYISTPRYLSSYRGRFISPMQGRGELRLESDALVFQKDWQVVTIPLASIRSLSRGRFPLIAKPIPIHFMGITFDDRGCSRTLLFVPVKSQIAKPSTFNALVDDWLNALLAALERSRGEKVAVDTLEIEEKGFWGETLKLFVGVWLGMFLGQLLIAVLFYRAMPEYWITGLVTSVIAAAILTVAFTWMRWWYGRRDWKKSARLQPPEQPPKEQATPMQGFEYRSRGTLWGMPWIHVTLGNDPETGRRRVARGVIAIGDVAQGVVAFGGMAMGGIAFGGLSVGVVSFAGLAVGLAAFGGLAIGLAVAVGGGAMGLLAMGGGALGYYAYGGGALGVHALGATVQDPAARAFFEPWAQEFMAQMPLVFMVALVPIMIIGVGIPLALQQRQIRTQRQEQPHLKINQVWVSLAVILLIMGTVVVPQIWREVEKARVMRFGSTDSLTLFDVDGGVGLAFANLGRGARDAIENWQDWPDEKQQRFVESVGANLMFDFDRDAWTLVTPNQGGLTLGLVDNRLWGKTPRKTFDQALRVPSTDLKMQQQGPWRRYALPGSYGPNVGLAVPITLAFETTQGYQGLLQVTGTILDPKALHLQWKARADQLPWTHSGTEASQ
jgi:serine/threonine protein kinase